MITFYMLLISLLQAYGAHSYSVVYTHIGDNVSLPCIYASSSKYLCWYRQAVGEQPQIIFSFYRHSLHTNKLQLEGNKRFSVHIETGFYHLNISNIQESDSAIYFCGQTTTATIEFDNGTFLVLKESRNISFRQQKVSDSVQPGDSVTLSCTVHSGTSNEEHTVYWFRRESRDSSLGVMYIHTKSSGQCVKSLESGSAAQSCVYSLSKRNVSLSDAGIYYCAVASCGEILFGSGTSLDVRGNQERVLMHCVVAALLVLVILNIILICICKMMKGKHLYSGGAQPQTSVVDTVDTQNEESYASHYVALDFKKRQSKRRRHRSTEDETVYSALRVSELK